MLRKRKRFYIKQNLISFNKYPILCPFMCIQKVCRPGNYGSGCGHLCNGYCLNNGICNHVDGVCLAGCQDGYIGKYCNICKIIIHFFGYKTAPSICNTFTLWPCFLKACKKGYFRKSCSSICVPHCKTCRHTDGHCSCFAGYTVYGCTTGKLHVTYMASV